MQERKSDFGLLNYFSNSFFTTSTKTKLIAHEKNIEVSIKIVQIFSDCCILLMSMC